MNQRAHHLMVRMRAHLETLPGASSIGLHVFAQSSLGLITAASDDAVLELANALGLGAIEVRVAPGRWWYRAASERDLGAVRVEVAGPHHPGAPRR